MARRLIIPFCTEESFDSRGERFKSGFRKLTFRNRAARDPPPADPRDRELLARARVCGFQLKLVEHKWSVNGEPMATTIQREREREREAVDTIQ